MKRIYKPKINKKVKFCLICKGATKNGRETCCKECGY